MGTICAAVPIEWYIAFYEIHMKQQKKKTDNHRKHCMQHLKLFLSILIKKIFRHEITLKIFRMKQETFEGFSVENNKNLFAMASYKVLFCF